MSTTRAGGSLCAEKQTYSPCIHFYLGVLRSLSTLYLLDTWRSLDLIANVFALLCFVWKPRKHLDHKLKSIYHKKALWPCSKTTNWVSNTRVNSEVCPITWNSGEIHSVNVGSCTYTKNVFMMQFHFPPHTSFIYFLWIFRWPNTPMLRIDPFSFGRIHGSLLR